MASKPTTRFHDGPALGFIAITPSDSDNLSEPIRGLLVGSGGDVKITTIQGQDVTLPNLVAGVVHPIAATKVFATGTAATEIFGVTTD